MMFTIKSLAISRPAVFFLSRTSSTIAVDHRDEVGVRSYDEIPGPKPIPILGNVWRFFPIVGTWSKMSISDIVLQMRRSYGDIVKLSGIPGRQDMIYVFRPEDAQKVFRSEGVWPVRMPVKSLSYYRTELRKDIFQGVEGVITSQGKTWQEFRTKVNQPMMQPRSAKLYVSPINEVAEDFIDRDMSRLCPIIAAAPSLVIGHRIFPVRPPGFLIKRVLKERQYPFSSVIHGEQIKKFFRIRTLRDENNQVPPDFINELYKWSLESIATVTLDTRLGCLSRDMKPDSEPQKMIDAVQVILEGFYKLDVKPSIWKYVSTPTWLNYVKALDYFTEVSLKYIREAMDRIQSKPVDNRSDLSMLERLLLTNDNPMIPSVMAMDMLFGGIDTTSHSVAILLFNLSKNPDKQEKLYAEMKRVIPHSKSQPITSECLNEMRYLKACLKESLRLDPITSGTQRQIQQDAILSDYHVPKGTDIFMCHQMMCRDEEHFSEPDRFIPERWLKGSEDQHTAHPFTFMPFGFGTRMCVGRRIAELEILILVAKIVRSFQVQHDTDKLSFEFRAINTVITPLNFKMVDRQ